jgi:hypothetical protein
MPDQGRSALSALATREAAASPDRAGCGACAWTTAIVNSKAALKPAARPIVDRIDFIVDLLSRPER